jgi:hypothetical protein
MRSDWVGAPLCRLYSFDHVHHHVRKVSAPYVGVRKGTLKRSDEDPLPLPGPRVAEDRMVAIPEAAPPVADVPEP